MMKSLKSGLEEYFTGSETAKIINDCLNEVLSWPKHRQLGNSEDTINTYYKLIIGCDKAARYSANLVSGSSLAYGIIKENWAAGLTGILVGETIRTITLKTRKIRKDMQQVIADEYAGLNPEEY